MRAVAPDELSRVWPEVEDWLAPAVLRNQGDENVLDVLIAIARGTYTLWTAPTMAAVTQTIRHPRQSVFEIRYAGGSGLDAMKEAFQFATSLCRVNGIDVVRVYGRRGWERLLGMEEVGVILQTRVK